MAAGLLVLGSEKGLGQTLDFGQPIFKMSLEHQNPLWCLGERDWSSVCCSFHRWFQCPTGLERGTWGHPCIAGPGSGRRGIDYPGRLYVVSGGS